MKKTPRITESEWIVMKIIWEHGSRSTNQIIEDLKEDSEWKPSTIKTLLNRLVVKGALRYEKDGRFFVYFPLVSSEDCRRAESSSFIKRMYDGSLKMLVSSFLDQEGMDAEDIAELKAMLDEKERSLAGGEE
jgi:BlaI family penicillinase repressor